jgi:hypothetical protein
MISLRQRKRKEEGKMSTHEWPIPGYEEQFSDFERWHTVTKDGHCALHDQVAVYWMRTRGVTLPYETFLARTRWFDAELRRLAIKVLVDHNYRAALDLVEGRPWRTATNERLVHLERLIEK